MKPTLYWHGSAPTRLNEVRPGRPEQLWDLIRDDMGLPRLNEVRPGRPEQSRECSSIDARPAVVSMKSGLEDRNNLRWRYFRPGVCGLNEVRPGRPEQCPRYFTLCPDDVVSMKSGLEDRNNPARCGRPRLRRLRVSMKSGLEDRNNDLHEGGYFVNAGVSMKSGLEDRNNLNETTPKLQFPRVSMKSGLEDRNNPARTKMPSPSDIHVSMKSGLEDRNNRQLCTI